jgi:hypothetical protein
LNSVVKHPIALLPCDVGISRDFLKGLSHQDWEFREGFEGALFLPLCSFARNFFVDLVVSKMFELKKAPA